MGLGGAVPARAGAEVEQLVLDTVDEAVAAGLAHRWATALWRVSDDRVHRWRARRAERGGGLEDRRPGGAAVHALLAQEVDAVLEIAEQWGPTDRSHRKLAHRGSYENSVWVSPSTFRRVLDANGLIVAQAPPRRREPRRPWPPWLVWEPNRIWIWDVTHFGRARRCVFAIVDMVSRRWISTVVSSEESSTQVRVVFDDALLVCETPGQRPRPNYGHPQGRSPHTNGVIERWFEALKYERLYREDIADGIDLAEHVAAFTDEYNRVRPHEALHWQRPLDAHLSTTTLKPNPPGTEQGT